MSQGKRMKKKFQPNKLSVGLTIAAVIVANVSIQFCNSVFLFAGLSLEGAAVATLLIALSTYSASSSGLRLLKRNNYTPAEAAILGLLLGVLAFTFVLIIMSVLVLAPTYWGRYFWTAATLSFTLGGFLAPITGAISGYIFANRKLMGAQNSIEP